MKELKSMTLQEFTTRLQSLCHDGYSQHEIFIDVDGAGTHLASIEDVKFCVKSDATKNGFINVKMGPWKNTNAF